MKDWKRTFTIIWSGQFLSVLSSTIVGYAIVLWLSLKTESAEVLAFGLLASLLPQALIGPFAGVYIDRWDRKKVMILADSFIAFCTLILALTFMSGAAEIWHIYLLLALRSIGSAFHGPAMQASVPLLAPESQLARVAGVNQMIYSVGNIAGPILAALFITFMDIAYILLFDIAGAIVACTALLFVTIPNPEKGEKADQHVLREIKEGLKEVASHKGMSMLFLFSILVTVCIMPVGALFPLMTLKHFGGDAFQIGLVEVFWGSGMLVGGAAMGFYKKSFNKVVAINITYLILGLSFAISGLLSANGYVFFVILTAFGGISATIYNASFTSLVQEKIDPAKLGRVFSMFMSIAIFPSLIGLLCTGFLADDIGLSTTFVILGSLICILGIVSFAIPSLMALQKQKPL